MVATRILRQAGFASLAALMMVSMVQAQQGPRGGLGIRLDRARLLGSEKVRAELKVEGDQATKVEAALKAYREERDKTPRPDFRSMSEAERAAYIEKSRPQRQALSKKRTKLWELSWNQLKRSGSTKSGCNCSCRRRPWGC